MITLHKLEVSIVFIVFLVTEQLCLILIPVEVERSLMPQEKDLLPTNLLPGCHGVLAMSKVVQVGTEGKHWQNPCFVLCASQWKQYHP